MELPAVLQRRGARELERLNWSALVDSIKNSRSPRAPFFKPVCVITAIDLANEGRFEPDDVDAKGILTRFSDYVTPFQGRRGADGHQPLWRLSNNRLWTFFKDGQALGPKSFPRGNPGSGRQLLDASDLLAINEDLRGLWSSPEQRRALRDQMLLMLFDGGDEDSAKLVAPLFNPKHLLDRSRQPSEATLEDYLRTLRQPGLFDENELRRHRATMRDRRGSAAEIQKVSDTPAARDAVENVPSPVDYVWVNNRIAVGASASAQPIFPFAASESEHALRLETCRVQAEDLLQDLTRQRWQLRDDYERQLKRYIDRLPTVVGSGNILSADAAVRILRDMFAAERAILPTPFAAQLRVLLQQHFGLRPFYPDVERFYRAVQTGRLDEPLPLDAVEGVVEVVREQTPTIFDESVSTAIDEAAAPDPPLQVLNEAGLRPEEIISTPPDPIGELDRGKAHDVQVAGLFNRLWKVFRSADDVQKSSEAWGKTFDGLSERIRPILDWLENNFGS